MNNSETGSEEENKEEDDENEDREEEGDENQDENPEDESASTPDMKSFMYSSFRHFLSIGIIWMI